MPDVLLAVMPGALAGAFTAALTSWWLNRHRHRLAQPRQADLPDDWTAAAIDQAAVAWAMDNNRPEAAGVMADKLHLLHRLGQRKRGGQR